MEMKNMSYCISTQLMNTLDLASNEKYQLNLISSRLMIHENLARVFSLCKKIIKCLITKCFNRIK